MLILSSLHSLYGTVYLFDWFIDLTTSHIAPGQLKTGLLFIKLDHKSLMGKFSLWNLWIQQCYLCCKGAYAFFFLKGIEPPLAFPFWQSLGLWTCFLISFLAIILLIYFRWAGIYLWINSSIRGVVHLPDFQCDILEPQLYMEFS